MEPSVVAALVAGFVAFAIAAGWIRDDGTGACGTRRARGSRPARTFAHPPRTRVQRAVHRAPIALYRWGLGALLGRRLVLLTHTGRRTSASRQVVLEVVGRRDDGYLVASGYGPRAQWFRNILADPRVRFQVGRHRHTGEARPPPPDESGRRLAEYARHHPRTAAALMRTVGQDIDGSPASYQRVGADTEHGVPLVALTAHRPVTDHPVRAYRRTRSRRVGDAITGVLVRAGLVPHGYLLSTRGRRTGRLHTIPITVVDRGARRWLVAPYGPVGWVHNARAAGRVTLRRRGAARDYSVWEVPPPRRPDRCSSSTCGSRARPGRTSGRIKMPRSRSSSPRPTGIRSSS